MTTKTAAAFAAILAAAFVAGSLAPRMASAHNGANMNVDEGAHYPGPPTIQVKRAPGNEHNAIVVSWGEAHIHPHYGGSQKHKHGQIYQIADYRVAIFTTNLAFVGDGGEVRRLSQDLIACEALEYHGYRGANIHPLPAGCIRRIVSLTGSGEYSETFSGLQPDTSYSVSVRTAYRYPSPSWHPPGDGTISDRTPLTSAATASITTASPPATPTDPEPPAAQTCTYEHRLIGVPGASAYAGRILVSSKATSATATIRAYQADNGHALDVLDADGRDVETIDLSPANSIKRFTLEGAAGWHKVTVEHASASAMSAATVAMRYRDPGGSVENTYAPAVEDCRPTSTTGTTTDVPTDPVTPPPSGPTGTGTHTGPEPEAPAPEPETPPEPETTAPTAPELAVALTGAVRSAGEVAVSGTVTNSGTTASASTRIRFMNGRQRVHTATVPAIAGGGVHAIRADVAMPEGSAVQVCIVPRGQDADPSNDCATAAVTQ